MSCKHYVEVAAIIAAERETFKSASRSSAFAVDTLSNVTRELALLFKCDNPRFDAGRFFDAAGFPELTATKQGLN